MVSEPPDVNTRRPRSERFEEVSEGVMVDRETDDVIRIVLTFPRYLVARWPPYCEWKDHLWNQEFKREGRKKVPFRSFDRRIMLEFFGDEEPSKMWKVNPTDDPTILKSSVSVLQDDHDRLLDLVTRRAPYPDRKILLREAL